jgi:hypothetical protein
MMKGQAVDSAFGRGHPVQTIDLLVDDPVNWPPSDRIPDQPMQTHACGDASMRPDPVSRPLEAAVD